MASFSNWFRANRKNLLLTFTSILITLFVGEVCLQIYYKMTNNSWLWQFNSFHVTYVKPVDDRRQYALRNGFSDSETGVSVNEKGFRAPVSMVEPDADTPVIVSLGDSKAFGAGVRDEETYSFLIDQKLRAENSRLRAVNAGIGSYNMRQALDRYKIDVVPNYNPKIITLQGAFNDISLLTYYQEKWTPDRTWADVRFAGFTPPLPVFQKIATFYYLNQAIKNNSQNTARPSVGEDDYKTYPDEAMIANLRQEIQAFIDDSKAKSIPVVLIPIDPFYYQTANVGKNPSLPMWEKNEKYVKKWQEMILHYDNLLVELSVENDLVYFFDARKISDAADRSQLYVDAFHYSAEGNRLISDGLYNFMKEKGLLEQK